MPELRKDPVVGRWVIIATERGRRPSAFTTVQPKGSPGMCPFCPGNEHETPPEVYARRSEGSNRNEPGWQIRVISNKYPALIIEGELNREPVGMYDRMHGIGAHEVIIETPDHSRDLVNMSIEQIQEVLFVFRDRMNDLKHDQRFKYILLFKNHGEAAGASLEHSHSQLIAMPIIPKRMEEKISGSRQYYDFKERCVFCDIIRQELRDQERIVNDSDSFLVWQPFASRFPFETCIIPKSHQSSFLEMSDSDFYSLADSLRDCLRRLRVALNDPPFNLVLHTRPTVGDVHEYFHWHIEVIPKLTRMAGFEWGSGFYINPTRPEDAASYLRNISSEELSKMEKVSTSEKHE